jgi:diaminopimelate decarboxylase
LQLGKKFGAASDDVEELLLCAKKLSLKVIGVSFHVGYVDYLATFS